MFPPETVAQIIGPTRARDTAWPIAPVLIQVPALSAPSRRSAGFREADKSGVHRRPKPVTRSRRRLRREFRVVGAALMVALPVSWTMWIVPWERPASATQSTPAVEAAVLTSADSPPVVSLRLEAAAPTVSSPSPSREARGPVALPGYIIPDDGLEEMAHAGS